MGAVRMRGRFCLCSEFQVHSRSCMVVASVFDDGQLLHRGRNGGGVHSNAHMFGSMCDVRLVQCTLCFATFIVNFWHACDCFSRDEAPLHFVIATYAGDMKTCNRRVRK